MNKLYCTNRDTFSCELANTITEFSSKSFQLIGKSGSGKKYVLEKVEEILKKKCEIYRIVSDTIMKKNQNIETHSFDVAFSLSGLLAMSISPQKNDANKINYIISNLKTLTFKKIILISALEYDLLPSESREFINIILCNKKIIEEKIKKKITIILTSNFDYFNAKYGIENIIFNDYKEDDVYSYLINFCGYTPKQISSEKLNQIYKLCGTNFNLVNSYAKLILNADQSPNTLAGIVDTKLNYYLQSGRKYNLTKDELETILFSSSMSVYILTPEMISYINNINKQRVEMGFACAVDENFLEEESAISSCHSNNFFFISKKEKEYLCKSVGNHYLKKVSEYYLYLSEVAEDEYFERSQYLTRYYGTINKNVFALLVLSISKSYLSNDSLERDKVISFLNKNNSNENIKQLFYKILDAYHLHYQCDYINSNKMLSQIDYSEINIVLAAELRRLKFKNGYLGHIMTPEQMNGISQELQTHLNQKLILTTDFMSRSNDEKILSLRIIYELAPFVLDTQNNRDNFCKLYDNSLLLVQYINNHFIKKSFAEYVINIFNRKAFLFAPPSQASVYYEQATAYFRENNIWSEYSITLASKAGNEIALHKYSDAIKSCKKALSTIKTYNLEILQKEKIYNNLYIAEFQYYEMREKTTLYDIQNKAIDVTHKLENLLTPEPCGRNHVILTNIASLYLYAGKEKKYYKTKKRLESSLGCNDVSELHDLKVNDFYRYHFAWYEFYINLTHCRWKKCTKIIDSLKSFYPAIFHNKEKMDLRVEAAGNLVKQKLVPNIKKYCINMLQYAPSDRKHYISRGLPLSDLQFTSWE